ncbi:hypothetical protein ACFXHA_28900 [Nocardia sp. NPDC059240]|uniref:hypothetical protein n=1 Tax=Nocardia sp. NPDC059240 TaxID=3346786 RepID=UPI0036CB111A
MPQAHAATCAAATTTVLVPTEVPVLGWSENLGYDGAGNLWVSRSWRNELQRYDSSGQLTGSISITNPSAVRLGPDGLMYVASGDLPANLRSGMRGGAVLRFDPAAESPVPEVFTTGLALPNGAAFDASGNLYVADSLSGVLRIGRDGVVDAAWSALAPKNLDVLAGVDGAMINGLAVAGDSLYVTVTASVTGRVLRVPIDAPQHASVGLDLLTSAGAVSPDDLTVGPDGDLYIATSTGALIRSDLAGREVCVMAVGSPVTSLAAVPGTDHELVAGTMTGDVLRIELP